MPVLRDAVTLCLSGDFAGLRDYIRGSECVLLLLAGAARFSLWRFTWTSAVGFVPLTAAVSYLGSEARTLSLSDPLLWGALSR